MCEYRNYSACTCMYTHTHRYWLKSPSHTHTHTHDGWCWKSSIDPTELNDQWHAGCWCVIPCNHHQSINPTMHLSPLPIQTPRLNTLLEIYLNTVGTLTAARQCTIYMCWEPCHASSGGTKTPQNIRVSHLIRELKCGLLGVEMYHHLLQEITTTFKQLRAGVRCSSSWLESWAEQNEVWREELWERGRAQMQPSRWAETWAVLNLWPASSQDTATQSYRGFQHLHLHIFNVKTLGYIIKNEHMLKFLSCWTAHMEPQAEGVITTEKSDVWCTV